MVKEWLTARVACSGNSRKSSKKPKELVSKG